MSLKDLKHDNKINLPENFNLFCTKCGRKELVNTKDYPPGVYCCRVCDVPMAIDTEFHRIVPDKEGKKVFAKDN